MSVAPVVSLPHPLVVAVEQIEGALGRMPLAAWGGLAATEIKPLVERLMRVEARVKGQQIAAARVLDASGLAKQSGATSTGAMLAGKFGGDRRAADAMVNQGKALASAPATEEALARGDIGSSQAAIIASAVGSLPDDVTPEQRQACEDTLIGDAGRYSLKDLVAGRHGSPTSSSPSPRSTRTRTSPSNAGRRPRGSGPSSGWSTTATGRATERSACPRRRATC